MDERKESTHGAADMNSDAHAPVPNDGNVTPGTTPNAADLTENELEDVVGGFVGGTGVASILGATGANKTAKTGGGTIFSGSGM
jgi:hypothetical protein